MVSVNKSAMNVVQKMVDRRERLGIKVEKAENGATIIDAGVKAPGGFLAGKYLTELCLGGLCEVTLASYSYDGLELPAIVVQTDYPSIALLGSQFAGWRISAGKYFAMGSGPARALSLKPKDLYAKIEYKDSSDEAVCVLESDSLPPTEAIDLIANACGVEPRNLYIAVAATSSIAGSTQISGRIVETGLHRLTELGFDPKKALYGSGRAPIAPSHPKSTQAMGRTNDMLMYAGSTYFSVDAENDEELSKIVAKAPSCISSAYGRPFYEIFKAANYDFYQIDPALFAPAQIVVNNIKSGVTFCAGYINSDILKKSIALTTP